MSTAMSFGTPNYSGLLYNRGNTRTPFLTAIGGKRKVTDHVEFVTGQEYNVGGAGSQPAISEQASLTAPEGNVVTRTQDTNVTQIFHESVGISDAKMSNMGTMSGINIAGQAANPQNELDFQVAATMQKIARDMEYTYINGLYVKATGDATANQSRGMLEAITTNTYDMAGASMTIGHLVQMLHAIYGANAPTEGLVFWCDTATMMQLNNDALANGMTIVTADRTLNGLSVKEFLTPFGTVFVRLGEQLPAGTAMLVNFDVISPVEMNVPGKGNFYMEELAKTGAGSKYHIFGQAGLDHGPQWYHGKFTNISTEFNAFGTVAPAAVTTVSTKTTTSTKES